MYGVSRCGEASKCLPEWKKVGCLQGRRSGEGVIRSQASTLYHPCGIPHSLVRLLTLFPEGVESLIAHSLVGQSTFYYFSTRGVREVCRYVSLPAPRGDLLGYLTRFWGVYGGILASPNDQGY